MANMSYCRFENTYRDLCDCVYALEEDNDISSTEKNYAKRIRDMCEQYLEAYDEWVFNNNENP